MVVKPVVHEGAPGGFTCSCTALRKATRRVSQMYDEVLAPSGLKATQRAILVEINRSAAATVGVLAEKLVMDPGALAHTLKPLERSGFIAITVDPGDRRNRLIGLTREGKAKLAETDALWSRAQDSFQAAFGKAETRALRQAMQMLTSDRFITDFKKGVEVSSHRQP
jgi:DNA-binding MarR family transcriptional regulator